MNAIEIRNLSKSFRGMYAVDHLNMTVPQGAIYGFIGENGSGKSTTMKLICGHLVRDEGEITLREGKFHQIKRMLEAVGSKITYLRRMTFGPLKLDESLSEGEWRELTQDEIKSLLNKE